MWLCVVAKLTRACLALRSHAQMQPQSVLPPFEFLAKEFHRAYVNKIEQTRNLK